MSKCKKRTYQSNSTEFVEEKREIRCTECLAKPMKEFLTGDRLDKRKAMAVLLWDLLGTNYGEKADPEVISLAIGRDKEWRFRQIKVFRAVQKSLTLARFNESIYGVNFKDYVNMLLDAGIIEVCNTALRLRVKLPEYEKCREDPEGDVWEAIYYYCISIVGHMIMSCYWDNNKAKATLKKKVATGDFVDASLAFIKGDPPDYVASAIALYIFAHLFEDNPIASRKVFHAGVLPKVGYYIHKDGCMKAMLEWYNGGIKIHELEALAEHQYGLIPMAGLAMFEAGEKAFNKKELLLAAIHWADTLQQCSFHCISHMAQEPARLRDNIIAEPVTMKSFHRWYRSPICNLETRAIMQSCLRVTNQLLSNSDFAWKIMDDFKFLKYIEIGVYYPDHNLACQFMEVCSKLGIQGSLFKKAVANSKAIMRAAAIHMYSFYEHLRVYSLAVMALCVDTESGARNVLEFFGPRHFLTYAESFDSKQTSVGMKASDLQNGLRRFARRDLDRAMQDYQRNKPPPLDREKASVLKEEGNKFYKEGNYKEAIARYSDGILACPATIKEAAIDNMKSKEKIPKWYHLPISLYCNRAQCHLQLCEYQKAVFDCDQAVIRCHGVSSETIGRGEGARVDPLHLKAMFRRSKALYELGNFFRAAMDVSECLIQEPYNEQFKTHMEKVLIRIRFKHSVEPFSRCDECSRGRGEKLKRCGQCTALYCSRECQEESWKKRHKAICKEFVEWKATFPDEYNAEDESDESPEDVESKDKENKVSKKSKKKKNRKKKGKKVVDEKIQNGIQEAEALDE